MLAAVAPRTALPPPPWQKRRAETPPLVASNQIRSCASDGPDALGRLGLAASRTARPRRTGATSSSTGEQLDKGHGTDGGSGRDLPRQRRRPGVVRTGDQPQRDTDAGPLSRFHRFLSGLLARGRRAGRRPACRDPRPAGARPFDQDGAAGEVCHRAALGGPHRIPRAGRRGAGRPAGPFHGRKGRDGRRPGPAGPGALADPHGHDGLVVLPARRGRAGVRPWLDLLVRPLPGHARVVQHRRSRGRSHRGTHAAGVAAGEGGLLRRHGRLRREGPRHRAPGRRGRPLPACGPVFHRLPDHGHRGGARPSSRRPGPRAGGRGGRRAADRHRGRLPLAAADARRRVARRRRGPSGLGAASRGAQ